MNALNCSVGDNLNFNAETSALYVGDFPPATGTGTVQTNHVNSCWNYWWGGYYPQVIKESYPVYLQERAKDSGKQAFEIIKALQDKRLMHLEKVSDFIEAMDILIKIL